MAFRRKTYGWYSAKQERQKGSAAYLDKRGKHVYVTHTDSKPKTPKHFNDFKYLGEVKRIDEK